MNLLGSLVCFLLVSTPVVAAVQPTALRCEYRVNPRGIDVPQPRLSWIVVSAERGQRQTAYRVLVASSPEKLTAEVGDLWDSSRIASDQTIHVVYAGRPLAPRSMCFWKVQIWDAQGKASPWSPVAYWTMGLLHRKEWQAQWIADAKSASAEQKPPHNGYHSAMVRASDTAKWVAIDLGKSQPIDSVRLYPARPFDWNPDTPGFLFPVRLKIEAGQAADGSDLKIVVDQTAADIANPGLKPVEYRFPAVTARLIRLTATRLARRDKDNFGLALAEMEVLSSGKNLALGAKVDCLDSIELEAWSKTKLVDGVLLPQRGEVGMLPATMLRKDFQIGGPIRRATIYATGLGLYELRLNGRRVGDQLLTPEWTRYSKRLQYQTYDVTALVRPGANALGAILGEGWYAGPLMVKPAMINPVFRLLLRMDVERADGQVDTIVTDPSWQGTTEGPLRQSGIYFGETYDATKEIPGWDQPGCGSQGWRPVRTVDLDKDVILCAQKNEPIRVIQELKPVKMTESKPGQYIFDLGQNMVGWCRLKVRGPAGTKVTLRHGEMLNDDGTLYTANLRGAAQVNEYTLGGKGEEIFEPHFTYHGFRYVELTGLPGRPAEDAILGRVFCSSAPEVGRFECSSPMFNRLMQNIVWTQRGNLMSAPTDCPQRTEREGWMGDIQAFSQTAIYNMDLAAFFTKWVPDIRDSQADDGRFPDIAPHVADPNKSFSGVPAWGDAGTIIPWRMYENYADVRLLEEHFPAARRWVDFIQRQNPDLLWQKSRGNDYGDWLNGDTLVLKDYPHGQNQIPKEVLATAFFARSTEIVAKMAKVLGKTDDAAKYGKLHRDIRAAFNRAYVAPDGKIKGDTQAGYALALVFNLLDEPLRPRAVEHLLAAIGRYKGHLSTGIQATHHAMLELTRNGRHEEACRLIALRSVPSWGYMIDQGATTIWERWDGYVRGRGFQNPGMNSFNHWAFGAVGEWLWRELAGIQPDEQEPGYKHFIIRPRPGAGVTWLNSRYDSIRGPIESRWKLDGDKMAFDITVPPNTTATVHVPAKSPDVVMESGKPLAKTQGANFLHMEDGSAVLAVESGKYAFQSVLARIPPTPKPEVPSTPQAQYPTRMKASDPGTWKPVPFQVFAPTGGVTLEKDGRFRRAMDNNISYLLKSFSNNHMLVPFRLRAGQKDPPDDRPQVPFWDVDLRGSSAGRFLMGAGNTLRWKEHPELRKRMDELIDGIEACRGPGGYILAFPSDKVRSEEPNYGRAWFTHGLIEAAIAGNKKAYALLRGHADWFNQWDMLPKLLYHSNNSHQGHIASTRTYFTPIGKPQDLQTAEKFYVCDWWMDQLSARREEAVWKYPLRNSHSYLITSFEAYLDHYLATGDPHFLEAARGAWDLIHDQWEHVGGSMAICEGPLYPPRSYFITAKLHTGETCGSVFWIKFCQRFHQLFPMEEKYVHEIEKSLYNVCLPNQVEDKGIRYHARLEGRTEAPTMINTCCEGQGTRLYGSLPEYIYSMASDGLFVNLFEPSSIQWQQAGRSLGLTMKTRFPEEGEVELCLAIPQPTPMKLRIRVPAWAAGDVPLRINGRQETVGKPGSYVVLDRTWADGDKVTFNLPMAFRLTRYTGADQIAGHPRFGLEYGPILLAVAGPLDPRLSIVIKHLPEDVKNWLKPKTGRPLHWTVAGQPNLEVMPYWGINDRTFTCFPVIEPM